MASRYERTENENLRDLDYKRVYVKKFDNERREFLPIVQTLNIQYPSFEEMLELDYVDRVWTMGDRYHKLAEAYYGDATYWWVIAWFNKNQQKVILVLAM